MHLAFDMFSGRPSPSWRVPSHLARRVFELVADSGLLSPHGLGPKLKHLGYRGAEIILPPELVIRYRVSPWLWLPPNPITDLLLFRELESIIRFVGFLGMDELLRILRLIIELLQKAGTPRTPPSPGGGGGSGRCPFETLPYDPGPWNDPAFKPTNNCYAYASNKRAHYPDKPQPGIASGAMFTSVTAADVSAATKRDGAHDAGDCFPDSEAPRLLVALVIWPGVDYHWYRKHPDFWGHKPGSTDARNIDNSGNVITNPQTCDRGPYTEFYGYMLMPRSQKVAA